MTEASLLDTGAEQLALDWSSPSDTAKAVPLIARAKHRPAPRQPPAPRRLAVVEPIAPEPLVDRRGLPRTEATSPGWRKGVAPLSKGRRYPPDPPTAEDINAMLSVLARAAQRGLRGRGSLGMETVHDPQWGGAVVKRLAGDYSSVRDRGVERAQLGQPPFEERAFLVRGTGGTGGLAALLDRLRPAGELEAGDEVAA